MDDDCLFVYGTLRRAAKCERHDWLAKHADFVGEATYQGRLYRVAFYPGVVASPEAGDRVVGEVYRLHETERVLAELDLYEQCGAWFPEPTEYVRARELVTLASGEKLTAWIYLYNHPVVRLERIRSGDFVGK